MPHFGTDSQHRGQSLNTWGRRIMLQLKPETTGKDMQIFCFLMVLSGVSLISLPATLTYRLVIALQ